MNINPTFAQYPARAEEPRILEILPDPVLPDQNILNSPKIYACFYKGIDPSEIANSPAYEGINQAILESLEKLTREIDQKNMRNDFMCSTMDCQKDASE